jgi:hypothetical protein
MQESHAGMTADIMTNEANYTLFHVIETIPVMIYVCTKATSSSSAALFDFHVFLAVVSASPIQKRTRL